jgi:two-component system phosphate regulon response regulator PhoB
MGRTAKSGRVPEGPNEAPLLRRAVGDRPRVLIAQDEPAMNEILAYILAAEGYDVMVATDGHAAMARIEAAVPDLVIADRALPRLSGPELARRLSRQEATREVPVLMLVHRGEDGAGAEGTLAKPFSLSELLARVRAALRRSRPSFSSELLTYAGIVVDLDARRVLRDGAPIHIGPTEFRLLCTLIEHPGRVFSREQLREAVWGHNMFVGARTVDVYIRRLRKALNRPGDPDPIRTVRSAGYALDEFAGVHGIAKAS